MTLPWNTIASNDRGMLLKILQINNDAFGTELSNCRFRSGTCIIKVSSHFHIVRSACIKIDDTTDQRATDGIERRELSSTHRDFSQRTNTLIPLHIKSLLLGKAMPPASNIHLCHLIFHPSRAVRGARPLSEKANTLWSRYDLRIRS